MLQDEVCRANTGQGSGIVRRFIATHLAIGVRSSACVAASSSCSRVEETYSANARLLRDGGSIQTSLVCAGSVISYHGQSDIGV